MVSGYECPVCSLPQQDPVHLANHMAMTAILHEDAHHEWLDDTISEWDTHGPSDLADAIVPHVTETTYPSVFEDTTDTTKLQDHQHVSPPSASETARDATTARVIERTREMMNEEADTDSSDST